MKCPICQDEMIKTENVDIYRCKEKLVWSPQVRTVEGLKVQTHLTIVHSIIYVNPETQKQELKCFEYPPYLFTIWDYDNHPVTNRKNGTFRQTKITERVFISRRDGEVVTEDRELFTFPSALDLPWDDAEQVMERVKMYLLFS